MKKLLLVFVLFSLAKMSLAQNVGVGTTAPTNYFHVSPPAGTIDPLRVELIRLYSTEQNLLVTDPNGVVKYMPVNDVLSNIDPNILDSLIVSTVLSNVDTLFNNQEVRDSVLSIVLNDWDSLYSLISDSLLRDSSWLNNLADTLNIAETLTYAGQYNDSSIYYVDENTDTTVIDLSNIISNVLNNIGADLTDDQNISGSGLNGTVLTIGIENGNNQDVNLQPIIDSAVAAGGGTDDQTIDLFALSGTTLQLSLEDDNQAVQTVNLSSLQDGTGTDDQQIDMFSLSGTTLSLSIEDDAVAPLTVNLASLAAGDVTAVTANNGLSVTSSGGPVPNVQLGGNPLIANTTIDHGANAMIFNLDGTGDFEVRDNNATFLYVRDNGRVGIGTSNPSQALEIVGRIRTNGINETSDRRFKKDIVTIESALEKLMKLRGVSYKWRTDEYPDKKFEDGTQLGVIAQEIEEVFPEVVVTDEEGYKSVEYGHLVPVLLEAIKELNANHEATISTLKNENEQLKAKVDKNSRQIQGLYQAVGISLD